MTIEKGKQMDKSKIIGLTLGIWLFFGPFVKPFADSPPNFLVIMTDDQGKWALGQYDPRIQTPNIDYLAQNGVRFDEAISPVPVCSPARASFFTGKTPSQHGVHDFLSTSDSSQDNWLEGERLISDELSENGYAVGLFGKWHADTRDWIGREGFDEFLTYDEREAGWINQYLHSGRVHFSRNGIPEKYTGIQARFLAENAIRFITRAGAKPFATFVMFTQPHFPFAALPERLVESYRSVGSEIVQLEPKGSLASRADRVQDSVANAEDLEKVHAENIAQYLAAVTLVDEQVGQLVDALESRDLLKNTYIIFTSDHGHMTGQYGLYGKGNATRPQNLYQESINIPLVIYGPEHLVKRAQIRQEFVNLYDLFPTILELSKIEFQTHYAGPGKSLVPLISGKEIKDFRRYQYAEYGNARMIHDGNLKLVRYYKQIPEDSYREIWFQLGAKKSERLPITAPEGKIGLEMRSALERFFSRYETSDHSGRKIWDLPKHNGSEPWR